MLTLPIFLLFVLPTWALPALHPRDDPPLPQPTCRATGPPGMDPGIAYDLAQIFCKDNEANKDANFLRKMTSADIHNRPFLPHLPTNVAITFERKNFKGECSTSCANIFRHLILSCQSDKHVITGSADVPANCGTYSYSVSSEGSERPSPKDCNTGSPFQSPDCPFPNGRRRG